ncbi:GNAT family N-acetyltransferase [Rhodobacteraceae bacterium CCMM004]|nr:GNAT family N-acetyltransferase [Rhodobacteraceae bacterium CCMM004]
MTGWEALCEATWPPLATRRLGPWRLRDGAGGGKRVSAATAEADWTPADIAPAAQAMREMGQAPLFMVRAGEDALDAALDAKGLRIVDPVVAMSAPVADLAAERPPRMSGFAVWPPLAVQCDIWAEGGIGPSRLAVMARVQGPKIALFGRADDRPAATAFVACHGDSAMLHALETRAALRRHGAGRHLMRHAALWAGAQGAATLWILVTRANAAARGLYASLGMAESGSYHYRIED